MPRQLETNHEPSPGLSPFDPPTSLGVNGQKLWAAIMAQYAITDSGGLAILEQAARSIDMAEEYAAIIARDGPTQQTRMGLRDHPLTRHVLAARALCARLLTRLGLNIEPVRAVGRPASGPGITWRDLPGEGRG
jgi:hypothetical protein